MYIVLRGLLTCVNEKVFIIYKFLFFVIANKNFEINLCNVWSFK